MADITKEDVIEFIANMSVLDLSLLVKEMEEKFGVSAAVPMAVAALAPAESFSGTACCDNPGSASYSPKMAMMGLPLPYSAIKAVGISATPAVMVNPSFFKVF